MGSIAEYQNIVIIGASIAGHNLVNTLLPTLPTTHRILWIEANSFRYWPIASLRAAVKPGWEDHVFVPLTTERVFEKGTPHRVIAPNRVVELRGSSVVLEEEWEGTREIPFFKCIIATGASQPAPMRPRSRNLEDAKQDLRRIQREIEEAQKIVVVGGGVVGVEFVGEVRDRYPHKQIALVHNRASLLNATISDSVDGSTEDGWRAPTNIPQLSVAVQADLESLNVDLYLDDRAIPSDQSAEWNGTIGPLGGVKKIVLNSGRELEADYVFLSTGNKPNSGLVAHADTGAVKSGMVWVDKYLRVRTSTPNDMWNDYYAIGDVSTTPGWKTGQGAIADGKFLATNLMHDIQGEPLEEYKRTPVHALMIPLGSGKAQGALTLPDVGTNMVPPEMVLTRKAPDLLVNSLFTQDFKGEVNVPQAELVKA